MTISRGPLDPNGWKGFSRNRLIVYGIVVAIALGYLISGIIGIVNR